MFYATLTQIEKISKMKHKGQKASVFYHLCLNTSEFHVKILILFQLFLE